MLTFAVVAAQTNGMIVRVGFHQACRRFHGIQRRAAVAQNVHGGFNADLAIGTCYHNHCVTLPFLAPAIIQAIMTMHLGPSAATYMGKEASAVL